MDEPIIIAAAQIEAEDENIKYNLNEHYKLIRLAAAHGVRLLVFPEMSITGYVREAANRLAFSQYDARLEVLRALSSVHDMIIIAGAPVRLPSGLHIGAFILYPDQSVVLYTKQYLYKNENNFFTPHCHNNPVISVGQEKISLGICFDMENKTHVANASGAGSTIYMPSIFYSETAMNDAHDLLHGYAKTYALNILMSNYSGYLYHTPAGGQSAFWNNNGDMLACLEKGITGLVLGIKENGVWTGKTLANERSLEGVVKD